MRKVFVGFAAVLMLSSCGNSESINTSADIRKAIDKTTLMKSSKVDYSRTTVTGGDGTQVWTGAVLFDMNSAEFTYHDTDAKDDIAGTFVSRNIDGVMYMRSEFDGDPPSGSKPWTKLDVDGHAGDELRSALNPFDGLAVLGTAGDDITSVAKEQVRGNDADRYRVQIDPKKLTSSPDEKKRAQGERLLSVYPEEPLFADFWVDKRNRICKLSMTIDQSKLRNGKTSSVETRSIAIEFYDFGSPVIIETPPADQTALFSEVYNS